MTPRLPPRVPNLLRSPEAQGNGHMPAESALQNLVAVAAARGDTRTLERIRTGDILLPLQIAVPLVRRMMSGTLNQRFGAFYAMADAMLAAEGYLAHSTEEVTGIIPRYTDPLGEAYTIRFGEDNIPTMVIPTIPAA